MSPAVHLAIESSGIASPQLPLAPIYSHCNSFLGVFHTFPNPQATPEKLTNPLLPLPTAAFDRTNNIMYVTISQRFAIWFIPFYVANVRLVSVLHLHQYQQQSGAGVNGSNNGQGDNQDGGAPMVPVTRYRIGRQEDHYQVNEWLKFILPGLGAPIWAIWQVLCAGLCFFLASLFTLLPALARLPMMAVHLLLRICRAI